MALPFRWHPDDAYPMVTLTLSAVLGETGSMPNQPRGLVMPFASSA